MPDVLTIQTDTSALLAGSGCGTRSMVPSGRSGGVAGPRDMIPLALIIGDGDRCVQYHLVAYPHSGESAGAT